VFITTKPLELSRAALASVRIVISVGQTPEALEEFGRAVGEVVPAPEGPMRKDAVLVWDRASALPPRAVAVGKAKGTHQRHTRKYAEGRLGEDNSFYFRGPDGALNLRAFNLATFLQLAAGVDDATWLFHLGRGDYARWFRDVIKDEELADEAQAAQSSRDAARSRAEIAAAVKRRYAA
jgi:hypothetical protein